jgi:prepilin-type N-terminal cleavage/methylation domain-containing protein
MGGAMNHGTGSSGPRLGLAGLPGGERGFSLIESLVAVGVLAFGMLAIAAGFTQGLALMGGSNLDILAREKAAEAIESVFTARDTRTISWAQIRNVQGETGSDGGVFADGPQPLSVAGDDGLVNTSDDGAVETMMLPGRDGLLGTDDDVPQVLTNFTREISIRATAKSTLRLLRVVIRYQVGSETREYSISTYISSYA